MTPTEIGERTAKRPGLIIYLSPAAFTIDTHYLKSGFSSKVKIPGCSLNYLLTSTMTSSAAFPTAAMAQEEKTNTVIDPKRPPTKISGTAISML